MSWRTLFITQQCKLSYKNDYLVIRKEDSHMIHLSEIGTVVIDSTMVSISSYLIVELLKRKIKIIYCDEKRNPIGEVVPYYGNHHSSKIIASQIHWDSKYKKQIWTKIIQEKILNQAKLLKRLEKENYEMLLNYAADVILFDETNREGHAAKVYFNTLFGKGFSRENGDATNAALDYGYTIILSSFNKEIVSSGYITQLGLKHKNEYNPFNLSSDLMEPFRCFVDEIVYKTEFSIFDKDMKVTLVDILNRKVKINNQEQYLSNAIQIYVRSVFKAIESGKVEEILFPDWI